MLRSIKKYLSGILLFLIFFISLAFCLKNDQDITLNYFITSLDISLPLLLFITLSIGAFIGIFVCLPRIFILRCKCLKLEKKLITFKKGTDRPNMVKDRV